MRQIGLGQEVLEHFCARLHVGQESHEVATLVVVVVVTGRCAGRHIHTHTLLDRLRVLVLGRVLHLQPLWFIIAIRLLDVPLRLLVVAQHTVDEDDRQPLVDYLHAKDLDRINRPHHLSVLLLPRKLHLVLVFIAVHVVLAKGLEGHSRHNVLQDKVLKPLLVHRLRVHLWDDDGERRL